MPEFRADQRRGVQSFFDDLRLGEVARRKKPTRYFWCDMTDLFGDWVPDAWIDRCAGTWSWTRQHTHLILTKRPERLLAYSRGLAALSREERGARMARSAGFELPDDIAGGMDWPLPNVWLGGSVEDQRTADERIPFLLDTPAAKHFVSYEPALGPVDFTAVNILRQGPDDWPPVRLDALRGHLVGPDDRIESRLSWVIVGGESGPGARPFHLDWARYVVQECRAADVACFVKQLGSDPRWNVDSWKLDGLRDRKGGDMSEWPEDLRVRQFPE